MNKINKKMNIIKALQFKHELNKYILKWLKLGYTSENIWESIINMDYVYGYSFHDFLMTKRGKIWIKKEYGREYLKWQMS